MKRFHQLTTDQQEMAINYTTAKIRELFTHGVVVSDKNITKEQLKEMAIGMAEDAWYSERTDQVISDIADGK